MILSNLSLSKSIGRQGPLPIIPENDNSTLTKLIKFQNSPEGEEFTRRFKKRMEEIVFHP